MSVVSDILYAILKVKYSFSNEFSMNCIVILYILKLFDKKELKMGNISKMVVPT